MNILKLTTKSGLVYFGSNYTPKLVTDTKSQPAFWKKVEIVEMTPEEYQSILATKEATELFCQGVQ